MKSVLQNFFTHKDFLPPAGEVPGTLFTPLHILFAVLVAGLVTVAVWVVSRKSEKTIRTVFGVLWAVLVVAELSKILWETFTGKTVNVEWSGILPLYPCSILMYALPFAAWGKGLVRRAACGYVCSLGLLGGVINFVYPANILNNYSCLSFAGFHTFFYHGAIVFCAATMLISGYHSYKGITKWWELLLPFAPAFLVSLVANGVNFSPIDADYMFFKLESFFFAPIGAATPDFVSVLIVYAAYILIHALPYLPSYIAHKRKKTAV